MLAQGPLPESRWAETVKVTLPLVQHNQEGFAALIELAAKTGECEFTDVAIDMARAGWFAADMCAPLGALLYRLQRRFNAVELVNIRPDVETILSRNGFLSSYGRQKLPDQYGTTIPYQRFDTEDDRYFADYVENKFVRRGGMPHMSDGLLRKFRESVFEIFSNAVIHSRTTMGIFSCGQCFPNKQRISFSVADLGIGIRKNVKDSLGLDLSAKDAIIWAMEGRNTTKRGPIPGGLGLKLLQEFIKLNGGGIQIVSDCGYWHLTKDQHETASFPHPFPGTVVTIEINTADTKSYRLTSEAEEADVF